MQFKHHKWPYASSQLVNLGMKGVGSPSMPLIATYLETAKYSLKGPGKGNICTIHDVIHHTLNVQPLHVLFPTWKHDINALAMSTIPPSFKCPRRELL